MSALTVSEKKGPLFILAASLLWSLGGICIKYIAWDAMTIIGVRSMLGAAVFVVYRRSVRIKFTAGTILTALCMSATTILFVFANKLTTAAAAILLQFTSPVFIILLQLALYRRKPRLCEVVTVSAAIAGMLLFFADSLDSGGLLGNMLALISGLTFAGVFVFSKRPDTSAEQSVFLGLVFNIAVGLPFAAQNVTLDPASWGAVAVLGILQVGVAYVFYTIGIKSISALHACIITALEPVLNPTLVALFAGEIPGLYSVVGGAVIILTVVAYNLWVMKHPLKE